MPSSPDPMPSIQPAQQQLQQLYAISVQRHFEQHPASISLKKLAAQLDIDADPLADSAKLGDFCHSVAA